MAYSIGKLRKVRAAPRDINIFSRREGGRAIKLRRLQNQTISIMMMGKKRVLRVTHTLVKPPFWFMATSQMSASLNIHELSFGFPIS